MAHLARLVLLLLAALAAFGAAGAAPAAEHASACTLEAAAAEDNLFHEAPILLQVSRHLEPQSSIATGVAAPTPLAAARGRGNRWRAAAICALTAAGVGVSCAALFLARRLEGGTNSRAVAIDLVCVFQENVLFTFTMLDALDLSMDVGKDAVYSGTLIGMHKVGTGLGSLLLWLLLLHNPELWRRGRSTVAAGVALQWVGAVTFGSLGILAREVALPSEMVAPLLCMARMVQGTGGGLQLALTSNHIARLVPSVERVSENMNFFLAACLGLGLGPLFASLVKMLAGLLPCDHPGFSMDSVLAVNMVLPTVQLVCLLVYPSLCKVTDQHSQQCEDVPSPAAATPPFWRVVVILCCVLMMIVRNFAVSSLEAALTMLLESRYHWSAQSVGPAIAVALSGGLWLKGAYDAYRDRASPRFWLRLMMIVAIIGSMLLIPAQPSPRPASKSGVVDYTIEDIMAARPEVPLLLGSALLFPALALSSGLVMGTLQDHVFPGRSFLNLNTATLLTLVGADLLGRGLGPWAARGAVAAGGQSMFAQQQLAAGFLALAVHEALVLAASCRRSAPHGKLICESKLPLRAELVKF